MTGNARLRLAPPARALAALRDALLPGGRVGRARRLPGGIAHGMHAVDLVGPDGVRHRLVVRRYPEEKVRRRPGVAAREHRTLELLRELGVPAPRPIWLDADGAVFGTSTLVTSRLPGRALIAPRDPAAWAAQLAGALASIHAAPLDGRDVAFLRQESWIPGYLAEDPPAAFVGWSLDWMEAWSAARAMRPQVEPAAPTLVHGDYWSGNTLWRRGRLVGVVDWDGCSIGDPGWDVGSARVDLAMSLGGDWPDRFLRAYERARGGPVRDLAFWDLIAATVAEPALWLPGLRDLGRVDLTTDVMCARLGAFVADALRRAR